MRYLCLLLVCGLLPARSAAGGEVFAEFLSWKATEPVDWVLNTNRNPADQYVTYETLSYDFAPGLRIGGRTGDEWETTFTYTHFQTSTSAAAAGDLTGAFLGGKLSQPPQPKLYFDTGQIDAGIRYNMFDLDLGKRYRPADALMMRPIVGLRSGWIHQSFTSRLQAQYSDNNLPVHKSIVEEMENNFWGVGPKVGIENSLNLWRSEACEVNGLLNFSAAYLWGQWQISDVTGSSTVTNGVDSRSTQVIGVPDRDFGALAFQAVLGLNVKYRDWSATVGYEINDWLNQCQIFDDATGPHNNDLILQGLTLNVGYDF